MVTQYEAFMNGAAMARDLARHCLEEANTADAGRAMYLISEHDRHIERAEDYEMRAGWHAPRATVADAA